MSASEIGSIVSVGYWPLGPRNSVKRASSRTRYDLAAKLTGLIDAEHKMMERNAEKRMEIIERSRKGNEDKFALSKTERKRKKKEKEKEEKGREDRGGGKTKDTKGVAKTKK